MHGFLYFCRGPKANSGSIVGKLSPYYLYLQIWIILLSLPQVTIPIRSVLLGVLYMVPYAIRLAVFAKMVLLTNKILSDKFFKLKSVPPIFKLCHLVLCWSLFHYKYIRCRVLTLDLPAFTRRSKLEFYQNPLFSSCMSREI